MDNSLSIPKILVCGGRDFTDRSLIYRLLDQVIAAMNWHKVEIISGAARGADSLAIDWAVLREHKYTAFPADWKQYGRQAGPIRNQKMLDIGKPDLVIAFPGGRGTADMIERTRNARVKLLRIAYDPPQ